MGVQSIILGTINGIGRKDFETLEKELRRCFEKIVWKDNVLTIKSTKAHAHLNPLFHRIAAHISKGEVGSLLDVADGRVACIYFAHKQVAARLYREPLPPAWWHTGAEEPPDENGSAETL